MTKEQALKLALETLEFNQSVWRGKKEALTAIKEALAQPVRTGWPAGLLQDDDRKLSKWLASKPDAKHVVEMAQRPWVGLTDEDKDEIIRVTESDHYHDILMLAEAKLKEKNS